jgi:hypothetical protein
MTGTDVPEEDRLAEAVVRGLREGAGASDGAAAIVEPVSRDVQLGISVMTTSSAINYNTIPKVLHAPSSTVMNSRRLIASSEAQDWASCRLKLAHPKEANMSSCCGSPCPPWVITGRDAVKS